MNFIDFNGHKVSIKNLSAYKPKTENEEYIKSFISNWLSLKEKFLFHTSGSTGKPKPIYLTKQQLEYSAQSTINRLNLKPHSNCLLCINPKFIGGSMMLVRALLNQMNIIYEEPSSTPLKKTDQKIHFAAFIPLQVSEILTYNNGLFQNIDKIIIGGGHVSNTLAERLSECKNEVYSTYGMTETASHIALKQLSNNAQQNYFTTLPDVNISVDDRNCLIINGPMTNKKDIITNDLVELLNSNKFRWIGRVDNVINSGGIKINAEELEEKICHIFTNHDINHEFFIYGKEDAKFGESITLVIKGKEESINLKYLLSDKLDKYEIPKSITFLKSFKYTHTGKINKKESLGL